jgi:hypothetical protein
MSNRMDSALRHALAQLPDLDPPPSLAAAAIRSARRQRRVRALVAGAATVAALVLATPVAFSAISPERGRPPGDPAMGPLVVSSIGAVSIDQYADTSLLLDRATGEYVALPYRDVTPSPDGTRDLVLGRASSGPQIGVRDTRTGAVRWIEGYGIAGNETVTGGTWSRDGQEILITERQGPSGFAIVEADTLEATFVHHDDIRTVNSLVLPYVWAPDGNEIALTQSLVDGTGPSVTAIRFYDRDGTLTRTVQATAALRSEAGFSPDGTLMALQTFEEGGPIQVVDVNTGGVYHTLHLDGVFVAWADEHHLIVHAYASLQVVTLAGEVIQEVALPVNLQEQLAAVLHIGSSDGLNPAAAMLTFGGR